MGVDVDSVIFVGKQVKDPQAYLIEKGVLTEESFEDFDGDWKEHILDTILEVHEVSGYSDRGYYIGFEICNGNPFAVSQQIAQHAVEFENITKEKAEFVSWAYYW